VSDSGTPSGTTPSSREKGLIALARQQVHAGGDSSRAPRLADPPQSFPGFDVLREIHRGGQGVVYQAIQRATKRRVAIKVFHEGPFAGARDRARFEREVDVLAQLEHPNIVGIIDRGTTENGSFFYVMDYVSGKTLDVTIADDSRTIDDALKLFAKICDAVNAAHLKGIIHRDLKPANIRVDTDGEPHVLDFGLAKVSTSELVNDPQMRLMTMTGQFIGSLPWASPEQASGSGSHVDIRSDVYSLGVILYQMLTRGRFPYPVVGNMRDVLDNIQRAEPARPSTIRRQINDEVETIVLKALAKDRDRRYQSAGDLARDIRRYLAGEPIEAKRDSGWYLLHKTIRRHKGSVSAAAGFVMLLGATAIVTGILYRQASAARDRAVEGEAAAVVAKAEETDQRRRAEANFNAVRGLARTFIFDFNKDIEQLKGATRARERLLTEALAYLNKVKDQGGNDPAFIRELANSYEKVGDIQAGLNMANLGGSVSAESAYAEARRLREQALTLTPAEPQLIAEHAQSMKRTAEALRRQRKHADSAAEFERALARLNEAIAALPPGNDALRRRCADQRAHIRLDYADTVRWLAQDGRAGEERLDEARRLCDDVIEYWKERVAGAPEDADAAAFLGEAYDQRARAELDAANARRTRAAKLKKEKPVEALALVRASMPMFERARAVAEDAFAQFERSAAAHPANAEFARDRWIALHNAGEAAMRLGYAWDDAAELSPDEQDAAQRASHTLLEQALESFRRGLSIAESLWNADESNLEAQRGVAVMLNKVGTVQIDLAMWEDSAVHLDRSIAVREDMFRSDATPLHRADVARALVKRGMLDRMHAEEMPAEEAERTAALDRAERFITRGLEHLRILDRAGLMGENNDEIARTERSLEMCRKLRSE
jgi:tRNA A-37 threonylcarbamoyl transferase component Bud32